MVILWRYFMFELERIQKIIKDLEKLRISHLYSIEDIEYKVGDYKNPQEAEKASVPYEPFKKDQFWGNDQDRYFFKSQFVVNQYYANKALVLTVVTGRETEWDALNPQFLMFINQKIKQGVDVNHREIVLTYKSSLNEKFDLYFHGFAGMQGHPVQFKLSVGILDESIEQLIYDLKVPYDAACMLKDTSTEYAYLINHLVKAINILYTFDVKSDAFNESVLKARQYLKDHLYNNHDLRQELINQGLLPQVSLIGHTHIDVAWLWTLRQTREKVVRSFSTVLNLMSQYPEYQFMASQPILLSFIEEDYPELFNSIKDAVKKKQFEIEGAMWLEADCNLSSGESLIRHLIYGKDYMAKQFNVKSEILWLPDVFGYSAALPQLLKQCDIHTFVTTKISWNEFNKMPYDTFHWEGLDGSEILTYFITMMDYKNFEKGSFKTVYEGSIDASQVKGAWARYQQKRENQHILVSYGYGDGGGGPTKSMLEQGRRLSHYIPGLPTVKFDNLTSYFETLHKKDVNWPKWSGELYLEYHRGTLTTMAKNKWYNRKSEFMYQNLEYLSTLAHTLGHTYEQTVIKEGWKTILLNQFHDIIPGTSIEAVYTESHVQYEQILKEGKALENKLMNHIASRVIDKGDHKLLMVFNKSHVKSPQLITFESECHFGIEGHEVQYNDSIHYFMDSLPSKGYRVYPLTEKTFIETNNTNKKFFDLGHYSVTFNDQGQIISLLDHLHHQEILKGVANVMSVYEDRPHNWDAWDINHYYQEKQEIIEDLISFKVKSEGPLFIEVELEYVFQSSKIKQIIRMYKKKRYIEFDTRIDWHESHLLLKVNFESIFKSDTAQYDTQFGYINRPTTQNHSWDSAKFEVCGHKYASLSQDNHGLALLNDAKYGYAIHGGNMAMSLLRSSKFPNPNADQGLHEFKYALLIHDNDINEISDTAYVLNNPPSTLIREGQSVSTYSLCSTTSESLVVDTIKKAENQEGWIVRVYQNASKNEHVQLVFNGGFNKVQEVTIEEKVIKDMKHHDGQVDFSINGFEVKTFFFSL